jgi:chromosome segregation ATPase
MAGRAIWRDVEHAVSHGIKGSRDALDRARSKARELGERGALRLDLMQLERQRARMFEKLGMLIQERLEVRGQVTVSQATPGVKALLVQIDDVTRRCAEKRDALEKLGAHEIPSPSVTRDAADE